MQVFLLTKVLGTELAIQTADTLKALGLLGLAAFMGPLVIGGLFFFLKKREE